MGMEALDLNSQGQGWPGMAAYQGILQSSVEDGGIGGSMGPTPVHVHSGKGNTSRTLGLRVACSGGRGGAMAGRAVSSSSSGGHGPSLPLAAAGVRGMCGSMSFVPNGSRSRGGRRGATSAIAEGNFNLNAQDDAQDNGVEEIFPNTQRSVHSQTHKTMQYVGC
jgi:hypothetical protein